MALVLLFLALTGGLLIALTPASPVQRMVALGPSERVVLLTLSPPGAEFTLPLNPAAATVIDKTPVSESPPRPSPEPIPPAPLVADKILADDVAADDSAVDDPGPSPPAAPAEDLAVSEAAEATPEPIVETVPAVVVAAASSPALEPVPMVADDVAADDSAADDPGPPPPAAPAEDLAVSEAAEAAPEPVVETVPAVVVATAPAPALEPEPEPAPAMVRPTPVVEPLVSSGDAEPVPYAIGDLAPDEAVAMPGDEPPLAVAEKASQGAPPETLPDAAKALPDPIWLAYARPSDGAADRPRIAVVVAGLGLGRAATEAAIKLPGAITLAFTSHTRDLQQWIDLARAAGHEILLDLPMEPENYPQIDPGPQALLTSLSGVENTERLNWHLDRAIGYVGVTHNMGSRFTASADHMRPILSALKVRGLMFLDARTSANSVAASLATAIGLPRAINNRFLDTQASRLAIDRRLDEIERIARRVGFSVAVSHAYPVTIDRLQRWIKTLDGKKLSLVPVSAVVNKQEAE